VVRRRLVRLAVAVVGLLGWIRVQPGCSVIRFGWLPGVLMMLRR
jgi:hypothetical protein